MAIIALQVLSFKGNLKAGTAPPQSMAVAANKASFYVVAYAIGEPDTLYYDGQPIIRPTEIDPAPPIDIQHLTAYLGTLKHTTNTTAPNYGEGHTIPCASYEEGIQIGIDRGLFPPTVAKSFHERALWTPDNGGTLRFNLHGTTSVRGRYQVDDLNDVRDSAGISHTINIPENNVDWV